MDGVAVQFRVVLVMATGGLLFGLMFDIHRVIRGLARPGRLGSAVGDLMFWCIGTSVAAGSLAISNYGELRLGAVLAFALGTLVYFRFLSRAFVSSASAVIRYGASLTTAAASASRGPISDARGRAALVTHRVWQASAMVLNARWKRSR